MINIDYHLFMIVAAFIALDVISGFAQACVNKTVDSAIMRRGLGHKAAYVLAIMLATLCEYSAVYIDLGFTLPIVAPVCGFICMTELVSILENLGKINPEIANSKLLDFFSQSRNRRDEDNDD